MSDSAKYRVGQLRLKPGNQLVLYTDGITESKDENEHLFGEGQLETALHAMSGRSSQQVVERVVQTVQHFSSGAPQWDDLTLLVLGYGGSRENDQST